MNKSLSLQVSMFLITFEEIMRNYLEENIGFSGVKV